MMTLVTAFASAVLASPPQGAKTAGSANAQSSNSVGEYARRGSAVIVNVLSHCRSGCRSPPLIASLMAVSSLAATVTARRRRHHVVVFIGMNPGGVALGRMGIGVRVRGQMVTVDRHIEAPTAAVWRLLVDLDAWPRWGPTVQRAALDAGDGVLECGARGRVWTPVGLSLPFTITEFVPGRRWAWTVAGVPATAHEVSPDGDGSRLRFEVPWWATAYLPVCTVALGRIKKLATRPM